ncbi:hypothetical protein MPTK1_2g10290 [Marchantia polymorpha subsp. ruderalis]|uniref:Uncharacterized protein n=1 Tax=Marchantia polymorpha TaxID=3197 RepID=A0A2R6W8I4_MARPO|nr:hypothetical protein MARPO_0129s0053 [Marchantia polymorpha]BBN01792.1 hypothetical protein Mp_2g10290 [Marchantia polymorpha subsp. ruderalis]|eukprot:PTQ30175.1 hypothetical protein MARPO_0129s0053 [Marchantia polymorpha]
MHSTCKRPCSLKRSTSTSDEIVETNSGSLGLQNSMLNSPILLRSRHVCTFYNSTFNGTSCMIGFPLLAAGHGHYRDFIARYISHV